MLRPYSSPALEIQMVISTLGILGNVIVVFVLSKKSTTWFSNVTYLRFILAIDSAYLLGFFIQRYAGDRIENHGCSFSSWMQTFPMTSSIWLTVALIFDQVFKFKMRPNDKRGAKIACAISLLIMGGAMALTLCMTCPRGTPPLPPVTINLNTKHPPIEQSFDYQISKFQMSPTSRKDQEILCKLIKTVTKISKYVLSSTRAKRYPLRLDGKHSTKHRKRHFRGQNNGGMGYPNKRNTGVGSMSYPNYYYNSLVNQGSQHARMRISKDPYSGSVNHGGQLGGMTYPNKPNTGMDNHGSQHGQMDYTNYHYAGMGNKGSQRGGIGYPNDPYTGMDGKGGQLSGMRYPKNHNSDMDNQGGQHDGTSDRYTSMGNQGSQHGIEDLFTDKGGQHDFVNYLNAGMIKYLYTGNPDRLSNPNCKYYGSNVNSLTYQNNDSVAFLHENGSLENNAMDQFFTFIKLFSDDHTIESHWLYVVSKLLARSETHKKSTECFLQEIETILLESHPDMPMEELIGGFQILYNLLLREKSSLLTDILRTKMEVTTVSKPIAQNPIFEEYFDMGWLVKESLTSILIRCTLNGMVPALVILIVAGIDISKKYCCFKESHRRPTMKCVNNTFASKDIFNAAQIPTKSDGSTYGVTVKNDRVTSQLKSQDVVIKKPICRLTKSLPEKGTNPMGNISSPCSVDEKPPPFEPNSEYSTLPFQIPEGNFDKVETQTYTPYIVDMPNTDSNETPNILLQFRMWSTIMLICVLRGVTMFIESFGSMVEIIIYQLGPESLPSVLSTLHHVSRALWWGQDVVLCSTLLILWMFSGFFRSQMKTLLPCCDIDTKA